MRLVSLTENFEDVTTGIGKNIFEVLLCEVVGKCISRKEYVYDRSLLGYYRQYVLMCDLDDFIERNFGRDWFVGSGIKRLVDTQTVAIYRAAPSGVIFALKLFPLHLHTRAMDIVTYIGDNVCEWYWSFPKRYERMLSFVEKQAVSSQDESGVDGVEDIEMLLEYALSKRPTFTRDTTFRGYASVLCDDLNARVCLKTYMVWNHDGYYSPDAAFMLIRGGNSIIVYKNRIKIVRYRKYEKIFSIRASLTNLPKPLAKDYAWFVAAVTKRGLKGTIEKYWRGWDVTIRNDDIPVPGYLGTLTCFYHGTYDIFEDHTSKRDEVPPPPLIPRHTEFVKGLLDTIHLDYPLPCDRVGKVYYDTIAYLENHALLSTAPETKHLIKTIVEMLSAESSHIQSLTRIKLFLIGYLLE